MFHLLAASDIDSVPADIFKYIMITLGWLVTLGGAAWGGSRLAHKGTKENPVAVGPQPFVTKKHEEPAKKSEHDSLRELVTRLDEKISNFLLDKARDDLALSEQINAQFNKMATDGQNRAVAITAAINDNVAELNAKNNVLAVEVANHSARLVNLEKADDRHEGAVTRIQTQIAQLIASPPRKAA
jgi:hypothetical protein